MLAVVGAKAQVVGTLGKMVVGGRAEATAVGGRVAVAAGRAAGREEGGREGEVKHRQTKRTLRKRRNFQQRW